MSNDAPLSSQNGPRLIFASILGSGRRDGRCADDAMPIAEALQHQTERWTRILVTPEDHPADTGRMVDRQMFCIDDPHVDRLAVRDGLTVRSAGARRVLLVQELRPAAGGIETRDFFDAEGRYLGPADDGNEPVWRDAEL